jgi:hypothetical protein
VEVLPLLLRDTAGDRHDRIVAVRSGHLTKLAETGVQLLLGPFPNAAGVKQYEVGIGGLLRRLETSLLEEPGHALRVVHVHLAPERLN